MTSCPQYKGHLLEQMDLHLNTLIHQVQYAHAFNNNLFMVINNEYYGFPFKCKRLGMVSVIEPFSPAPWPCVDIAHNVVVFQKKNWQMDYG